MRALSITLLLLASSWLPAQAQTLTDGLVAVQSPHNAVETLARAERWVQARGLTVFARVDHGGGAAAAGLSLRPTLLLLFGHAKGGTPLMQCAQSAGIDLPLKLLAWEDEKGQTWLGFNDPVWLMRRHGAPDCAAAAGVRKGLDALAQAAISP